MGTLTKGKTFGATEEVTAAKLHQLIDSGTISHIVADDIDDGVITNAKIVSVAGDKLTELANIPAGAGVIPAANLTSVAQKGANSDITSLTGCTQITGMTTPLTTAQGGTGSSANANAASGVVVLDASSKLPAVDGSQITNITTIYEYGKTNSTTSFADPGNTERVLGKIQIAANALGTDKGIRITAICNYVNAEGDSATDGVTLRWRIGTNGTASDTELIVHTKDSVANAATHTYYVTLFLYNTSASAQRASSSVTGDTPEAVYGTGTQDTTAAFYLDLTATIDTALTDATDTLNCYMFVAEIIN